MRKYIQYFYNSLLLLLLLFFGMLGLILGLVTQQLPLTIIGGVFILVTIIAFLSSTPAGLLWGVVGGGVLGASAGAWLGMLLGEMAGWLAGVVGGAIIGMMGGVVFTFPFIRLLFRFPTGDLPVSVAIVPKVVLAPLIGVGMVAGLIFGILSLREITTQLYGAVGGGALAGGVVGMLVGLGLAVRNDIGRGRLLPSARSHRQLEQKRTALARHPGAANGDLPAVGLDDGPGDGQA